jgi:hypothetical protein
MDNVRNQLIMFGGYTGSSTSYNDVWTYSISDGAWLIENTVSSTLPGGRLYHSCAHIAQTNVFYVHGGYNSFKDLWNYDLASKQWTLMDSGAANVQLDGHSMKYSNSLKSLLIFLGGGQDSTFWSKVYKYSLPSGGWTEVVVGGTQIPGRHWFSTGYNPQTGEHYISCGNSLTYYGMVSLDDKQIT